MNIDSVISDVEQLEIIIQNTDILEVQLARKLRIFVPVSLMFYLTLFFHRKVRSRSMGKLV